jgi:hypothetical protein
VLFEKKPYVFYHFPDDPASCKKIQNIAKAERNPSKKEAKYFRKVKIKMRRVDHFYPASVP